MSASSSPTLVLLRSFLPLPLIRLANDPIQVSPNPDSESSMGLTSEELNFAEMRLEFERTKARLAELGIVSEEQSEPTQIQPPQPGTNSVYLFYFLIFLSVIATELGRETLELLSMFERPAEPRGPAPEIALPGPSRPHRDLMEHYLTTFSLFLSEVSTSFLVPLGRETMEIFNYTGPTEKQQSAQELLDSLAGEVAPEIHVRARRNNIDRKSARALSGSTTSPLLQADPSSSASSCSPGCHRPCPIPSPATTPSRSSWTRRFSSSQRTPPSSGYRQCYTKRQKPRHPGPSRRGFGGLISYRPPTEAHSYFSFWTSSWCWLLSSHSKLSSSASRPNFSSIASAQLN